MMRLTTSLIALLGVLVAVVGCTAMTGKSFGQQVSDKMTTASVKTKLIALRAKNTGQIGVDTNHGVVYLTGTVPQARFSTEAEQVARTANGVRDVVNQVWVSQRPVDTRTGSAAPMGEPAVAASPATATSQPAIVMAGPAGTREAYTAEVSTFGEVTQVDRARNRVTLRTAEGDYDFNVPGQELGKVREGDQVQFTLAMRLMR
jgi:hyperosmotically inducible protein